MTIQSKIHTVYVFQTCCWHVKYNNTYLCSQCTSKLLLWLSPPPPGQLFVCTDTDTSYQKVYCIQVSQQQASHPYLETARFLGYRIVKQGKIYGNITRVLEYKQLGIGNKFKKESLHVYVLVCQFTCSCSSLCVCIIICYYVCLLAYTLASLCLFYYSLKTVCVFVCSLLSVYVYVGMVIFIIL